MQLSKSLALAMTSVLITSSLASAAALTPLTTFGGGDGWLAPGEGGYGYLGTGNNERGLAYGNGHLYLVSRSNPTGTNGTNVRFIDATTGADTGALSTTGVTGGTFTLNAIGVAGDGAIYSSNLVTASAATGTSAFKVYGWASDAAAATVAYSGTGGLTGARVGDSLAVNGSGSSTRVAAGYSNATVVAGNNGYGMIDPTASSATGVAFTGTPPLAGDFRLGLTFLDATHILGDQGSSIYRYTSFSGAAGTLIASPAIPDPAGATADRLLATTVVDGVAILAIQSVGDSHVSVYNINNPAVPIYIGAGNNTSGTLTANGNGTGQIAWGPSAGTGLTATATLYALSTNQGIQAFTFTLPEPASLSMMMGAGVVVLRRRR